MQTRWIKNIIVFNEQSYTSESDTYIIEDMAHGWGMNQAKKNLITEFVNSYVFTIWTIHNFQWQNPSHYCKLKLSVYISEIKGIKYIFLT